MKHLKRGRKFGRVTKQRRALMRALANALIESGKITTTEARAKSLRIYVDKLVTTSKLSSLARSEATREATLDWSPRLSARRGLVSEIGAGAAKKLIGEIAPRYAQRPGGYTRIIRLPPRVSDGSKMAIIEFVKV